METPPVPSNTTVSPAFTRPCSTSAFHAVTAAHGDARVLVFSCEQGAACRDLAGEGVAVLELPCVAALPPPFIDYVLTRITLIGALYLTVVCLLPEFLIGYTGIPFYFGGTSLLIVVSVTMDTVAQVQGHLMAQQYEGLIKKSKLRGGKR